MSSVSDYQISVTEIEALKHLHRTLKSKREADRVKAVIWLASGVQTLFMDLSAYRPLASGELLRIQQKIDALLKAKPKLDAGSLAHLTTLRERIKKLIEANVVKQST